MGHRFSRERPCLSAKLFFLTVVCLFAARPSKAERDLKALGAVSPRSSGWCRRLVNTALNRKRHPENPVVVLDPLGKARQEFGPELRAASAFEIEFLDRKFERKGHTVYWYGYKEWEIKFSEIGGSHGHWVVRTLDRKHHFSLAAELPRARKIAAHLAPRLTPDGFTLSADGRMFAPEDAGENGHSPQPTVATLNRKYNLSSKSSAAVFAISANPAISNMFGGEVSLEFMEILSRGQIPVAYGWPYPRNVRLAERILKLANATDWPRFRRVLTKAVRAASAPELMAHERFLATNVLSKAYWLLADSVIQADGDRIAADPENFDNGLRDLEETVDAFPDAAGSQDDTSYVLVRPADLALIMDDWKYASSLAENGGEMGLHLWLTSEISRDYDSTFYSGRYQRLQFRIWTHLQLPLLREIEIPPHLDGRVAHEWWIGEVERLLGNRIRLRRVPYSQTEVYRQQAAKIYLESFWADATERSPNEGREYSLSGGQDIKLALHTLGIDRPLSSISMAELKSAYRKTALKFHPDQNGSSNEMVEAMKRVNNAKDVILTLMRGHE